MTTPTKTPESPPKATPEGIDASVRPVGPPASAPAAQVAPEPEEFEASGSGWIRRGPRESTADYDARWLREVYAGDVRQFTWRSTLIGCVLGGVFSVTNLYVGLKAGWSMPMTITGIVLVGALMNGLERLGAARRPMGLLEQNCTQTTASAANVSSAIFVTAVPAYMLATGVTLQTYWLALWAFFVTMLGMAMVVFFERRFVRHERLAWPSSVAAAQTLLAFHQKGRAAAQQARWLLSGAAVAGMVRWSVSNGFAWWKLPTWPETVLFPGRLGNLGFGFDASLLYVAIGGLIGPAVSAWMVIGATAVWGVFAPWLMQSGRIDDPGWSAVMLAGALWAGAGTMIGSGLTVLAMDLPVLWRGLRGSWTHRPGADSLQDVELPRSWGVVGFALASIGILAIGHGVLGVPWWASLLGIVLSCFLTSVILRAVGETDINPVGSLGKFVQLGFGASAPHALATNLFGTTVTVASGATAGEAAGALRCGHLLGAAPRQQFLAMASGILVAIGAAALAFGVLVPEVSAIGTAELPAPAAQAWRAVAELMAGGFGVLDGVARTALLGGLALGVILALGDLLGPRRPAWWPSAFGLGIGMVVGVPMTVSFLAGSLLARWMDRRGDAEGRTVALASGAIAGDSLMGVLLAALIAFGWMAA